jgi:hypothetical protein
MNNFPKKRIMCQNGLWSMPKENIRRLATEVSKLLRGKKFYSNSGVDRNYVVVLNAKLQFQEIKNY